MKKHIWIMNHYAGNMFFDHGGRHYCFAKYLAQEGYKPVVFCANSKHNAQGLWFDDTALWHTHTAEEINVPFVFVRSKSYTGNGKQRVLNMLDFYYNVKKAAKEYATQNKKPDIIFASSVHPLTLVAGIQLAKQFGVKCICEVRDLWPETIVAYSNHLTNKNPLIKLLYLGEKWIYKKADAIVFTMEGAYDYIIERGWERAIPHEKVYYINNGVDLELFNFNRDNYQIEDSDLNNEEIFKVVYTGSIRKVNNLGLLLDAAKKVTDSKTKFLIWGAGDELEMLKQRLTDEGIRNVVFKGKVEKKYIPFIVSRSDLNIAHNTPSLLFRFGISFNKLFDYLAAEKPVLSDFPCKYNPAIQEGAGWETDSTTAESIADAVEKIVRMPRVEYGVYCKHAAYAARKFDFKNLTHDLLMIIGENEE